MAVTADQLVQTGLSHQQAGRLKEARAEYERALQLSPGHGNALGLLAVTLSQLGDANAAIAIMGRALQVEPGNAGFHVNLGNILQSVQRFADAVGSYQKAIAIAPQLQIAHVNLANALMRLGQPMRAAASYRVAISLAANNPGYHFLLGNALQRAGDSKAAIAAYNQSLLLQPGFPDAVLNLGVAHAALDETESAISCFRRVLGWRPADWEAHINLGLLLQLRGNAPEADQHFRQAVALNPASPEGWLNLGVAQNALGNPLEARESWHRALALRPEYAEAYINLADIDNAAGDFPAAVQQYEAALKFAPGNLHCRGALALARLAVCDWSGIDELRQQVVEPAINVASLTTPLSPFVSVVLPVEISPIELRGIAERHARRWELPASSQFEHERTRHRERLRIGYVSGDFQNHATAHLTAGLFEQHDRARVEVYGYSFGADDGSAYRGRIAAGCDVFRDIRSDPIERAARRILDDEIDVLIDLKGYTQGARPRLFAWRAAPVQVQYLGYPGTMGASFIDYLLTDRLVTPAESAAAYSEKLVYLPGCYQINDDRQPVSAVVPSREASGLPAEGVVFCCFNGNYKIEPGIFRIWMDILRGVPGSVLWLYRSHPLASENLRTAAAAHGIDAARLIFAEHAPKDAHLARHQLADLFLDTHFCNAHTTASDALWAGVPVLTCPGNTFASRVATSLVHAAGLPQMSVATLAEYRETATRLGRDCAALADLRRQLIAQKSRGSLFDTKLSTRNLEAACFAMLERHLRGEPPSAIELDRS
jgi:predicted O-linked N-acetylglucosamine transferase (SPINDLY family)